MEKTYNIFDRPEHEEQCAVFTWAKIYENLYPDLKYMFAIPNGGMRPKTTATKQGETVIYSIEAAKLKKEGVKPGVPDVMFPSPRGAYHGLFIEMKRRQGGVIRKSQKQWLRGLAKQGYYSVACEGSTAAIRVLERYLSLMENERILDW